VLRKVKLSVDRDSRPKIRSRKKLHFKAMSDQNRVKQPAARKFHRVKQGQNRAKSGRSSNGVSAGLLVCAKKTPDLIRCATVNFVLCSFHVVKIFWAARTVRTI
jgi:hypothetical protein